MTRIILNAKSAQSLTRRPWLPHALNAEPVTDYKTMVFACYVTLITLARLALSMSALLVTMENSWTQTRNANSALMQCSTARDAAQETSVTAACLLQEKIPKENALIAKETGLRHLISPSNIANAQHHTSPMLRTITSARAARSFSQAAHPVSKPLIQVLTTTSKLVTTSTCPRIKVSMLYARASERASSATAMKMEHTVLPSARISTMAATIAMVTPALSARTNT